MRYGAAQHLKRREPGADEVPIRLPAWAADRVEAAAAEIVAGIRASGVRVIGDLDLLTPAGVGSDGSTGAVPASPAIAATMSMGLLYAAGAARRGPAAPTAGAGACPSEPAASRRPAPPSAAERLPAYMVAGTHRDARARDGVDPLEPPPGAAPAPVRAHGRRAPAAAGAWPRPARRRRRMGMLGHDPWRLPSSAWHPPPTANPCSCPRAPG